MAARSYSRQEAEAAVQDAIATVRTFLGQVDPSAYHQPSILDGWSVRDLMAHIARNLDAVAALEPAPRGTKAQDIAGYLGTYAEASEQLAEMARELGRQAGDRPLDVFDETRLRMDATLASIPTDSTVVMARRGPITLVDFLITRLFEYVIHSDDLARSLDIEPPTFSRDVIRMTVRGLLDTLAALHPGNAVEVRVPPYAAVQCIAGPRHTRGTPSNVVETDAWTWIRLAAGRTTWSAERAAFTVSASGERADLSDALPLF